MVILIPAYNPDVRLPRLIREIRSACRYPIVVVNDGSDSSALVFEEAAASGAIVLTDEENHGKGYSLRRGFAYIREMGETEGVVTVDASGRYGAEDILRIAEEIQIDDDDIVLGARRLGRGTPFRAVIGNQLSSLSFFLATGQVIRDTQTGLRGYPAELLPWLSEIGGDKFEYELDVLLTAADARYDIRQIEIRTSFPEDSSTGYRPLADTLRMTWPIIRHGAGFFASAVIDFIALILIYSFSHNLVLSICLARLCSMTIRISANRRVVFDRFPSKSRLRSAFRFTLLVVGMLLVNILLMTLFKGVFHIFLVFAKIATEILLFTASYFLQKIYLYFSTRSKPV